MRFILTLLFALFCAPHPAAASAPHEFYGVIAADDPDQTELARMSTGGVGTLRIDLVWGAVESGPGAQLDWSHYDTLIGDAARQGIRVLPTVYSSPPWAAARDFYPPERSSWDDYSRFVRSAAARYGNRGSFWSEHPEIPRLPVTDWQLWNEPNLQGFWLPNLSAKSYVALLRVFSRAIHSAILPRASCSPGSFRARPATATSSGSRSSDTSRPSTGRRTPRSCSTASTSIRTPPLRTASWPT